MTKFRQSKFIPLIPWVLTALLAGCGGGGGGDGSAGTTAVDVVQSASVSLILTDASIDEWDQALATITSVELLGDEERHVLFAGEETVDLLRLRDFTEVFAIDDGVTPGSYEKIRLRVSDLVFVRLDEEGFVAEEREADLVANGKIDLNPRGSIDIAPGEVLFITLDFDMDKSFKLIETGNGRLKVRPVIFVRVGTEPGFRSLARVRGVIDMTSDDYDGFLLCQTELVARPLSQADDDDDTGDSSDSCLRVVVDADTGIFDINGLPLDPMLLEAGDPVTVIGRLARRMDDPDVQPVSPDDDDNSDDDDRHEAFALHALVIEEGPAGTWSRIAGLPYAHESAGDFVLAIDPAQGFAEGTTVTARTYPGTRAFTPRGEELDMDEFLASLINQNEVARINLGAGFNRRVIVDAVLALSQTEEDVLRSALIVVGDDAVRDELSGELLSVDEGTLTVATDTGDRCVLAADAIILQLDAENLDLTEIGVADLATAQALEVFGTEDTEGLSGCFIADVVIARPVETESAD